MTFEAGRGLGRLSRLMVVGCSTRPEIDFSCLPIVPPALPGCICATATAGAKSTLTAKMSEQTKYIGLPKKANRIRGGVQFSEQTPRLIDLQQLVSGADPMQGRAAMHTPLPQRAINGLMRCKTTLFSVATLVQSHSVRDAVQGPRHEPSAVFPDKTYSNHSSADRVWFSRVCTAACRPGHR